MTDVLATKQGADVLEQVVMGGDLSRLSAEQRLTYYRQVCESMGLNPLTKPFDYIKLNGKLTLYARRDCTDQLRKLHSVSVAIAGRERQNDLFIVTARATLPDGRADESIGAVSLARLQGDNLANALMKAETKAKRRVTLSIVGLGWLDENEVVTVPSAQPVTVSVETGEIREPSESKQQAQAVGWATWRKKPEDLKRAHDGFHAKLGKFNLSHEASRAEFGVTSMKDYQGTMQDAADVIEILDYATVKHSLNLDDLHNALGVDATCQFDGAPGKAKAHIDDYIAQLTEGGVEVLEQGEMIQEGM